MITGQPSDMQQVSTYCYQCRAGPDLLNVKVVDGVATEVEPNFNAARVHTGAGKVCVKAYGLIQKTYNPHRVLTPMKRTNPKKGRDEDPGFVPISWDEALDAVVAKLSEAREKGSTDESGFPRVAATFGGGGTPYTYMGTFPAFLIAWGPVDRSFGGGAGVKCHHSEHVFGEFWHRGPTVHPDTPLCEYVVSFGENVDGSGGVCGVKQAADARVHGGKRVQLEPHLSVTAASGAEWVPIKPKTDAAFLLAMIHVLLHEHPRERLDLPFLKHRTSSPYLVAHNGFYLRDPESHKPLIWDIGTNKAVAFDMRDANPALDGEFTLDGIETGADEEFWEHKGAVCKPAFTRLLEHVETYTPEWASEVCDVSADVIRRIANEYIDHARVGETTEIDGRILPFRPVAVTLGKNVNNGWGGYECCWGRTVLACLVGALDVPGGTLGSPILTLRPTRDRLLSIKPGPDGFMEYPINPTGPENGISSPTQRHAGNSIVPLEAPGPTHHAWLMQMKGAFPELPEPTLPDVWFVFRSNPVIAYWDLKLIEDAVAKFPFTVCFAYTRDETNHMADILLPECTDLEGLQLIRIGGQNFQAGSRCYQGFALRQPVVEAAGEARDFTWISTQLASRLGILEQYNAAINDGGAGVKLQGENYDFSLGLNTEHSVEEIWDASCRAANGELTSGQEGQGLEYFLEHGFRVVEHPRSYIYLYPEMEIQGLRFELPYQERLLRVGRQLGNRLHEKGIRWWDTQLAEYEAMPAWRDIPGIWERVLEEKFHVSIGDFPFWLLTSHNMPYVLGANVGIQMIKEVADHITGHGGIIMNTGQAEALGIADGDMVEVRSPLNATVGHAVLRQGIRPDTVLMIGQFGHWATPLAKDFKFPSMNPLVPILPELTDAWGSGADLVRVTVTRIGETS
jgi:phenylacetyl-CoA:acceptor oxidoreductase